MRGHVVYFLRLVGILIAGLAFGHYWGRRDTDKWYAAHPSGIVLADVSKTGYCRALLANQTNMAIVATSEIPAESEEATDGANLAMDRIERQFDIIKWQQEFEVKLDKTVLDCVRQDNETKERLHCAERAAALKKEFAAIQTQRKKLEAPWIPSPGHGYGNELSDQYEGYIKIVIE